LVWALLCSLWSLPGSGCLPLDWKAETLATWITQGTPNADHAN